MLHAHTQFTPHSWPARGGWALSVGAVHGVAWVSVGAGVWLDGGWRCGELWYAARCTIANGNPTGTGRLALGPLRMSPCTEMPFSAHHCGAMPISLSHGCLGSTQRRKRLYRDALISCHPVSILIRCCSCHHPLTLLATVLLSTWVGAWKSLVGYRLRV